jgi:hypothetical protein
MNPTTFTPKQKRLLRELDQIASLLHLNYREIREYEPESRTVRLEQVKRHFVRGEVVLQYTLVDEFLNNMLCHHFFGRRISFIRLWKTNRFRLFNYFVIEKLSLMEKLAFVKAIKTLPKSVVADVERLNAVRNGIARAFFPENLRSSKPTWKGQDLFSLEGITQFTEDMSDLYQFFFRKMKAW